MIIPATPDLPLISGAFHYARVHPEQWAERLRLCRAMGLDTVETYVPWNLHEPRRGEHRFDGLGDLGRFLDLAALVGLRAIVRPGPYICAEWDNGGLPAWLSGIPGIRLRTADPVYLEAVDAWFDVLVPVIASRQTTRGGNVCLVQVENEYGSYGSDQSYLTHLRDGLVARGIDVPLVTSDGSTDAMLTGGMVAGVWASVNFGSDPERAFETLRRHRPDDPPFCMEFWNGWFDHWGEQHHVRETADAADTLDRMLAAGASVNLYMAHGGTSFGCTAGANHDGRYRPTTTSYDYDAPIDEAGRPTKKFWAYREVIGRYAELPAAPDVTAAPVLDGDVHLSESLDVRAVLSEISSPPVRTPHLPTYEELGLAHGIVRHRARIPGPRKGCALTLPGLADRAHVYAGGELLRVVDRDDDVELPLDVPAEGLDLEVVVESMGRVNYAALVGEPKGLVGGVLHGGQHVHGWETEALELPDLPALPWSATTGHDVHAVGPHLVRGWFEADERADGFLALDGWRKGYVWVNGFCLGRYWDRGPQRTLYLPRPAVVAGANEVVVLELDAVSATPPRFVPDADLG